jgi:hypothetical protein
MKCQIHVYMHECLMGYKNEFISMWEGELENSSLIGNMKYDSKKVLI